MAAAGLLGPDLVYVVLTSLLELSRNLLLFAIFARENAGGRRLKLPLHVWDCNKLSGMSRFSPTWLGGGKCHAWMMDGIDLLRLQIGAFGKLFEVEAEIEPYPTGFQLRRIQNGRWSGDVRRQGVHFIGGDDSGKAL